MQEKSKEKLAKYLRSIARYVLLVLGILVFIFALLSGGCSKDENPTEAKNDLALVGYWELTEMSSEDQGVIDTLTESQIDSMGLVWTLKIEDDGTIEQTTNMSGPLVTMPGTWSTSANQLTTILTGPTGAPPTTLICSILYSFFDGITGLTGSLLSCYPVSFFDKILYSNNLIFLLI
jgi:hypothetical protein